MVASARSYSADDPCPSTEQRLADHNAAMSAANSPTVAGLTRVPTSHDSTFVVNPYVISQDDLSMGNAITACFSNADLINRMRIERTMPVDRAVSRWPS